MTSDREVEMLPSNRPDPYNGFKSDRERRLALNTKVRWYAGALMVGFACDELNVMEALRWLMKLSF